MQDLTWAEVPGSELVAGFVLELPAALTSRLAAPNLGTHLLQRVDDTRHGAIARNYRPLLQTSVPDGSQKS